MIIYFEQVRSGARFVHILSNNIFFVDAAQFLLTSNKEYPEKRDCTETHKCENKHLASSAATNW